MRMIDGKPEYKNGLVRRLDGGSGWRRVVRVVGGRDVVLGAGP